MQTALIFVPPTLPVRLRKLIVASLERFDEIAREERSPPDFYHHVMPVVVGLGFVLFPDMADQERDSITTEALDFFRNVQRAVSETRGRA